MNTTNEREITEETFKKLKTLFVLGYSEVDVSTLSKLPLSIVSFIKVAENFDEYNALALSNDDEETEEFDEEDYDEEESELSEFEAILIALSIVLEHLHTVMDNQTKILEKLGGE